MSPKTSQVSGYGLGVGLLFVRKEETNPISGGHWPPALRQVGV
jgi:hypothetical protein